MSAAIKALGLVPRLGQGRRIAVLGDMAELGEASKDLHMDIAGLMDTVDIDLVFSCGPQMAHMFAHLPPDRRGIHAPSTDALTNILQAEIHAGDVVMVKGSHASQMNGLSMRFSRRTARADQQGSNAMLYELMMSLKGSVPGANLFSYITFRAGGAVMTALIISFILGPWVIDNLRMRQGKGQPIREDGPQSHLVTKVGTPTMGGLLILLAVMASTLLWGDLSNPYLWIVSLTTLGFGLVGFADDFLKVRGGSSAGVSGRVKIVLEAIIALVAVLAISTILPQPLAPAMPFRFSKMCFCPLACPCLCWPACLSLSGLPMRLI